MNLKPLFQPRSMAVIGVSRSNQQHPANVVFNKNFHRLPPRCFAINPKGGTISGEGIYLQVADLPEPVDLAVIAVRAEQVLPTVEACIAAGVGGAVVLSGGFAETGRGDLQQRLAEVAIAADFPVIGPNCLGIYAPGWVDTLFLPPERTVQPAPGNVALVSQSGGVLVDQLLRFAEEGVGLSLAVSIGNKAVIREPQLLRYLADDPQTRVIAFYMEGFGKGEGRRFVEAARECPKPVIVLKSGKTAQGSRAVSSHTASLAGDYKVFSSVLAQYGVIEARNEFQLTASCESLSCYAPNIEGRVAILTGSGGHGALAVDACDTLGLTVPGLTPSDKETLYNALSPAVRDIVSLGNPVDLTGSACDDDFVAAARQLLALPTVDCMLALLLPYIPGITSDLGARLSQVQKESGKPLIAYVPHMERYRMIIEGFELNNVPVSHSIEGAVYMVGALRREPAC